MRKIRKIFRCRPRKEKAQSNEGGIRKAKKV